MTYAWSTWLLEALRSDPFVAARLEEVPGWRTRGRPPADFSYFPSGIVEHHTACFCRLGHDPQSCLNGILNGNSVAPGPISQLLGTFVPVGTRWNGYNLKPRLYICAAGRSNHAGSGTYRWGAPAGNGSSIGIEWCGPPESNWWPDEVIELRERASAAILRWNGWNVNQLTTHHEYAGGSRKIDPSASHRDEPTLGTTEPWDANLWRTNVQERLNNGATHMAALAKPYRILDTRDAVKWPGGLLKAGVPRRVGVTFDPNWKSVFLNLVAVKPSADGFLTVWPGGDHPGTSNLNFQIGETRSGLAFVALDSAHVTIQSLVDTHCVIDVQGYEV